MYQLIATVQTLGGMADQVVYEGLDLDIIAMLDSMWVAQEATLFTRVEFTGKAVPLCWACSLRRCGQGPFDNLCTCCRNGHV